MSPRVFVFGLAALVTYSLAAGRAAAHPGSGIAVDDTRGHVYFADTREGLWRVDADGGHLTLIKAGGLHWMTMDRAGRFANSPERSSPFTRLTRDRHKPTLIGCLEGPCAVGTDGNLYYAKAHGLTITQRTPSGAESVLVEKGAFGASRYFGVTGIACGPDGTLYLVALDGLNRAEGRGAHEIWAVKPDGTVRAFTAGFLNEKDKLPPAEQDPHVRPEYCRGIAVDGNGDVYVAVTGNRCVVRLTAATGQASVVHRTTKPWTPTGVDVSAGTLYVLEYDGETPATHGDWPPRVTKVGRDGKVATLAAVRRERSAGAVPKER